MPSQYRTGVKAIDRGRNDSDSRQVSFNAAACDCYLMWIDRLIQNTHSFDLSLSDESKNIDLTPPPGIAHYSEVSGSSQLSP